MTESVQPPEPAQRESIAALFMRLYRARYTGWVVLHFGSGVANIAEVGNPTRIVLDKRRKISDP